MTEARQPTIRACSARCGADPLWNEKYCPCGAPLEDVRPMAHFLIKTGWFDPPVAVQKARDESDAVRRFEMSDLAQEGKKYVAGQIQYLDVYDPVEYRPAHSGCAACGRKVVGLGDYCSEECEADLMLADAEHDAGEVKL